MSANIAAVLYLVAGVLFILALRGLSSPDSSRRGNQFGMIGMTIAVPMRPAAPVTRICVTDGAQPSAADTTARAASCTCARCSGPRKDSAWIL